MQEKQGNQKGLGRTGAKVGGDVADLTDDRVHIPIEAMRACGWQLGDESLDIVIELVERGHLRLHRWEDIGDAIEAKREELERIADVDEEALQELFVLDDKYRRATLYKSDSRVRLVAAVLAYMRVQPEDKPLFYVRASKGRIEILSLDRRDQMIARRGGRVAPR